MLGRRFEHVQQGGDKGVDPATEVLQVDEDRVERPHRLARGPAHFTINAEHRHLVHRISEIVRFHHIILLVTAQAMLRTESSRNVHSGRRERVEAVREVARDRRGMRQKCHALTLQRAPQLRLGEQPVDSEQSHGRAA